jgi:hypothetical protein
MTSAGSLKGLMKWLNREEWRQPFNELFERHVGPPCKRAGIAITEVADKIGNQNASTMWGCVFEDFLACDLDDDSNIVDDYLKRRGWKESVPNKRYMTALRSSVMSLYEVSDVVRDQSFLARDLLRGGKPVRISEKSATRSLRQWDRIAARVVRMGSRFEMAGGVLAFSHELSEVLCEEFAALRKDMLSEVATSAERAGTQIDPFDLDTEVLRYAASLFTHIWLDDALQQMLNPRVPTLHNSDGDEIALTTVRYPLKATCDRAALQAALMGMPDLQHHAGKELWTWTTTDPPAATKLPGGDQVVTSIFSNGSVSLGSVELEAETLRLETNSPQRAQRGRALLEPVIAPFVGQPVVKHETQAEIRTSASASEDRKPSSRLSPEEERTIIEETIDRHYRSLLDQPVPLLGDVSPRKAAETKAGREKLVAWLKLIENANARQDPRSPMAAYDLGWMWKELGIEELRR